jgi:mevalonate pyrophosphate decarboxylase
MFTAEQANYLHSKMRELEEDVRDRYGINVHFGIYSKSKAVTAGLTINDAVARMARALNIGVADVSSKYKPHNLSIRRFVMAHLIRE